MATMAYSNGTSRAGTPRRFKPANDKAVFLTGLKKLDGTDYDSYRTQCYNDLQGYGSGSTRIYVKKFDYPRNGDCAYLHLKTRGMADLLKRTFTLKLAGDSVKVYEYNPSESRKHEEITGRVPKTLLEPSYDSRVDSGMNSPIHTPARMACSPRPAENTTATTELDNLATKLATISKNQIQTSIEKISIPESYAKLYPSEHAQMRVIAVTGAMQGLFTEEEYNARVAAIYDSIILPKSTLIGPEMISQWKAMAFHGIMRQTFTVDEFNAQFEALFVKNLRNILIDQTLQIPILA